MIYGNPIDFAIWFDKVPEWSNPNFIEGVFIVIVDSKFLPEVIQESATLLVQLGDFDWILSKLNEYKENVEDDICKEDLYFRAHNPRFGKLNRGQTTINNSIYKSRRYSTNTITNILIP